MINESKSNIQHINFKKQIMENLDKNSDAYLVAKARVKKIQGFYSHLIVYLVINIFLIFGSFYKRDFNTENFFRFSTFATAFFWGIGLFFHALGVFGRNIFLGKDWEERKIQEFMTKK